ncbi:MAG: substrate-binding domain-containing protein [Pseudomonadota bacterium]
MRTNMILKITGIVFAFIMMMSGTSLFAGETIQYSCSAQVYEAFGDEMIDTFTKETGIDVKIHVSSSRSAVHRLLRNFSDIASTVREIYPHYYEYGYVQIPFCRDSLAVIANKSVKVDNFKPDQLRSVFYKETTDWKDIGDGSGKIVVVIPGHKTGAFENFDRQVVPVRGLRYDFLAYQSTMVIRLIQNYPNSVSFIGYGAVKGVEDVNILKIDGLLPDQKGYPYYQIMSFVTKGEPSGPVQKFVNFVKSEKGRKLIEKRGMRPIQ